MSVNFTIHGPFPVPTKQKKIKGGATIKQLAVNTEFWKDLEVSPFAGAKGCYVFANAVGGGSKPVYVGQTNRNFKSECFSHHNKNLLNDFLSGCGKTGLQIFFVVLDKTRKNSQDEIEACETFLIQKCKHANADLLNTRKLAETFSITDFHGDSKGGGKPTNSVRDFKKCLRL